MVLRLELPKYCEKYTGAIGVTPYLDDKRVYRVRCIDGSVGKYPMRKIDNWTFEFDGEFELREVKKGLFDIYGK